MNLFNLHQTNQMQTLV